MAQIITLHSKSAVEAFVRQHASNHLFELGDLDDYFWPYTTWYGWRDGDSLQQLALVYSGATPPVLLAYPEAPREQIREFLKAPLPLLPRRVYAHLDPEAIDVLAGAYRIESKGLHLKMELTHFTPLDAAANKAVSAFSRDDHAALKTFYQHIPDMIINERSVEMGVYCGIRSGDTIISAAGLHAYAPGYKVVVIGNVATHPDCRRQGLSRQVCGALCQKLRAEGIEHIGLNVKTDNIGAIRLYEGLGFTRVGEFGAYMLDAR